MSTTRFALPLDDEQFALATRPDRDADLPKALRAMGLTTGVPTVLVAGATVGLTAKERSRMAPLFERVVVPVVTEVRGAIVDDGARVGVAGLVGGARQVRKASFPLLAVAPELGGDGELGGGEPGLRTDLDARHTHVVLVARREADEHAWWLVAVAGALAGDNRCLTLVTGGGSAAATVAEETARAGRPVLAVARTGGLADELAAAARRRQAGGRSAKLVRSGLVEVVDPSKGADHVTEVLGKALGRKEPEPGAAPWMM